jgi:hypothetical protein
VGLAGLGVGLARLVVLLARLGDASLGLRVLESASPLRTLFLKNRNFKNGHNNLC